MKRNFFSEGTKWELRALKGGCTFLALVAIFNLFDQNYDIASSRIPLIKRISLFIPVIWLISSFLGYKVLTSKNYATFLIFFILLVHITMFFRDELEGYLYNMIDEDRYRSIEGLGKWTDYIFFRVPIFLLTSLLFLRLWAVILNITLSLIPPIFLLLIHISHPKTFLSNDYFGVLVNDGMAINSWFLRDNIIVLSFFTIGLLIIFFFFQAVISSVKKTERANAVLGRYFSPEIKEEIEKSEGTLDKESSKDLDIAILFTDIVGFTKLSEKMDPKDVLSLLSEYQTMMVDSIFSHKGTVDKFIGDAVMANFGTPKSAGNDAQNAFDCALTMNKKLKDWNKLRNEQGLQQIEHRIGIHYGPCVFGNIGSELRTEFAVIGDPVNVASRICDSCKEFDTNFIISKDVASRIGLKCKYEDIQNYKIRGRKEGMDLVKIYN